MGICVLAAARRGREGGGAVAVQDCSPVVKVGNAAKKKKKCSLILQCFKNAHYRFSFFGLLINLILID